MENFRFYAPTEVFWASSLSHNNLTECGRGKDFSVHKLGHALSAKYDVTHGDSLSAVWGSWARELYMEETPRFARFARKVWSVSEENDAKAALMGIETTENFFKSIGMTVSLKELGVDPSEEDLEALSLDATMQGTLKLSRIRPLGEEDVNRIYTNAIG